MPTVECLLLAFAFKVLSWLPGFLACAVVRVFRSDKASYISMGVLLGLLLSFLIQAEIDGLLDYVGRMRAIGIQSRKAGA